MIDPTLIILFLAAIPIGICAIVFGGTMFFSVPVFQILFPEMTLGALIGNIKPGSVVRNVASLLPLRHDINYRGLLFLLIPLALGSVVGAFGIVHMSQAFVLPILLIGFLITEYAKSIEKFVPPTLYVAITFLVGAYGGIFGAGISLLIVALLRIKQNDDQAIYKTRADALFLETVLTALSVGVVMYAGLFSLPIALTWAAGAIIGGYCGGLILKRSGSLSGNIQKLVLRGGFAVAVLIAASQLW